MSISYRMRKKSHYIIYSSKLIRREVIGKVGT